MASPLFPPPPLPVNRGSPARTPEVAAAAESDSDEAPLARLFCLLSQASNAHGQLISTKRSFARSLETAPASEGDSGEGPVLSSLNPKPQHAGAP